MVLRPRQKKCLEDLPNELLVMVSQYLDLKSRCVSRAVCRRWRDLAEVIGYWQWPGARLPVVRDVLLQDKQGDILIDNSLLGANLHLHTESQRESAFTFLLPKLCAAGAKHVEVSAYASRHMGKCFSRALDSAVLDSVSYLWLCDGIFS